MPVIPAALMPEDRGPHSLEAQVIAGLKVLGLYGYHPRNSIGSARGWPDWVIVGDRGVLFRELKTETGTLSPEQRAVGSKLTRAGQDWAVWRPRDLYSGVILRQLQEIA